MPKRASDRHRALALNAMLMRAVPALALTMFCGANLWQIVSPPTPRLLYNTSLSAPQGWYRLYPDAAIERGGLVAAFAPALARKLAHNRGYLPHHVPLIKTVWAGGGAEICSKNGTVSAPNRPDIYALAQDGLGRDMPGFDGCFTLDADEVFLISIDVQTSFDSRYFGAVAASNVLGRVEYMGGDRMTLERRGAGHGERTK